MARFAQRLVALPYRRFCGKVVQGYRIGACLGIGGSGVTFEAAAPDGRPVALKLLRPLRTSYDIEEVWREVGPLGNVAHPGLPEWLGILRDGRAYFIVLSRMPGRPLDSWLFEDRHAFKGHEFVDVCLQLIEVLDVLHAAGLTHGDVRPANVLYDGEQVSLVDFGLSLGAGERATDIAGFADLLLYLLYSSVELSRGTRTKAESWRDELPLETSQRRFLDDAFEKPQEFAAKELRLRFVEAFGKARDVSTVADADERCENDQER
ncbi:MAG: protein kinase [Gordonibacter sp.]|uniref:protein kinase domain-containing protein n=1 Tax=Gordonibacter sp. TaxID=1968902 RepID=UPI002FC79802